MATPSNEVPKFVARYIENFIDLVENVPNDLSRRISRLHELQLEYESTLEKLETSLTRFCRNGKVNPTSSSIGGASTTTTTTASARITSATTSDPNSSLSTANDLKQLKYLLATQNYLARMSELSDNKLAVMQDALDQLDTKSRELDHDFKLINTALSDGSEPNTSTSGTSGTTNNKGTRSNGSSKNQASASAFVSSRDRDKSRDRDSSPEPTYCICNQVSYGDMICCDNRECEIEWFHFQCVSLTSKPKGKWYCPNCRGDRSNQPKK